MWLSIGAFVLFHLFPTAVLAQMWASTAIIVLPAVDHEELASLTAPQRKARQLATILIDKPEAPITVIQKNPLRIIAEQTLQLGTRWAVVIFNASHVEGRLVGGRQTFTSSVDHAPHSVQEDAQRPLFVPPSEGVISLEIIVK